MKSFRSILAFFLALAASAAFAADTIIQGNNGTAVLDATAGVYRSAVVGLTTDGNGHLIPIGAGSGGSSTAIQGAPAAVSSAWPTKVTDGTNSAAVKPASTAAAAADPSLVVGISPNSPLPAGANAIGSVSVSNFPATQTVAGTVGVSSLPAIPSGSNVIGSVNQGGTWTDAQGNPAVVANAWPIKPCDGTNCAGITTTGSGAVQATAALVGNGTNPLDGQTVTFTYPAPFAGTAVFTFRTTPTLSCDVAIGANQVISATNLTNSINAGVCTPSTRISATFSVATITVTAGSNFVGTAGNALTWSTTAPGITGTGTFTGGSSSTLAYSLKVDGSAVTQPISAASLPLPSNAAQETGGHLASVDTKITTTVNGVKVDGSAVTQPVSAASLPLPSNAAQESGGHLASLDTKVTTSASGIKVDGSAVTQPVSGTVTANMGTTGGLALDTSLQAVEGAAGGGTAATKSLLSGGQYLLTRPTLTSGQQSSLFLDSDGSLLAQVVDPLPAGTNNIGSIASITGTVSLPTGASTAANQTTEIGSLSTIATNTTGVATAANQTNGSHKTQLVNGVGTEIGSTLATAANQTAINTSLGTVNTSVGQVDTDLKSAQPRKLQDGAGTALTSTLNLTTHQSLDINPTALEPGAATAANQATGNTSLATIATNTTGVATAANQTTGNTSLSSIATNTTLHAPFQWFDTNQVLDASVTNIPASASAALQVVASLTGAVHQISIDSGINAYINVYEGATLRYIIPPLAQGDDIVFMNAASSVSVRNNANAAITTGTLLIQFR